MIRNVLAAALRHLARSRLYTAVSVAGLAVGLCVVLMVALVIRNQYSYDHDLPGYQRTWVVLMEMTRPGQAPQYSALMLPRDVAVEMEAARVGSTSRVTTATMDVEVAGKRVRETVHWADAAFPEVLPQKVYAGDAAAALRTPDGVMLSRS